MIKYSRRWKIPEINSGSSADIAFLLLIFFLVTSSFDSKMGIDRKMNPPEAENVLKQKLDIRQKNLLSLTIDADNRIFSNGQELLIPELRKLSKAFIIQSDIPKHVISLEIDRKASYQTYLSVISELTAAYHELRKEAANEEQRDSIRAVYPMRIVESELPVDKEGGEP